MAKAMAKAMAKSIGKKQCQNTKVKAPALFNACSFIETSQLAKM